MTRGRAGPGFMFGILGDAWPAGLEELESVRGRLAAGLRESWRGVELLIVDFFFLGGEGWAEERRKGLMHGPPMYFQYKGG